MIGRYTRAQSSVTRSPSTSGSMVAGSLYSELVDGTSACATSDVGDASSALDGAVALHPKQPNAVNTTHANIQFDLVISHPMRLKA